MNPIEKNINVRSEAIRAWFSRLLGLWREAWDSATESKRQEVQNSLHYLGAPVQAWVYVCEEFLAHAIVIRHVKGEPDGEVRFRFMGATSDVALDKLPDRLVMPHLEWQLANLHANRLPKHSSGLPLVNCDRLDLGDNSCIWWIHGDPTTINIKLWVERVFQKATPASTPPHERLDAPDRPFLYEAGQDRERLSILRWLSSVNGNQLFSCLGLVGPIWCVLNAPRSKVFGKTINGDVDLLAGPIEFDITDDEWKKRMEIESCYLHNTANRNQISQLALARACEEGKMIWPPRMETVVGCEVKASWFEPEGSQLKATHASKARRVQGQLRFLLKNGVDRVAFLHLYTTRPRYETHMNQWFQALYDSDKCKSKLNEQVLLFNPKNLPDCGYYRAVIGAVCMDNEDRSGARKALETVIEVSGNRDAATAYGAHRDWRKRLQQQLTTCGPTMMSPRVFIICCHKCGRWTPNVAPVDERCACES